MYTENVKNDKAILFIIFIIFHFIVFWVVEGYQTSAHPHFSAV